MLRGLNTLLEEITLRKLIVVPSEKGCTLTRLCLGTLANSVDPDQTTKNAASDQGLHCSQ